MKSVESCDKQIVGVLLFIAEVKGKERWLGCLCIWFCTLKLSKFASQVTYL